MKSISFFASGDPKGQPRPRAFARKMGNKFVARVYDAGTAECWKGQIAIAAKEHIQQPFQTPVRLEICFNFKRPKGHFTSKGLVRPIAPRFHTAKPDADNAAKAVMDALSQLGAWLDDKQVALLIVRKEYAIGASPGGACITITELEDIPTLQDAK